MELREALAEVRHAADPQNELDRLLQQIGQMIKTQVALLAVQFEDSSPAQLAAAAQTVQKMQFLNKLHAEAESIDAELEDSY
jgi:molecular chaperone HscB